jgi:hypothetical protein
MSAFKSPTTAQVKEALRRIPTPQLRRAFYEGLQNPLWLEPLKNEGAFMNPPPRMSMTDGSTGDPYWPEIEYVIRVANEVPEVAVDILLSLKDSENAWVRRALFAIGAAVPASEAARLNPVLKAWIGSGFGWRTDPREMVNFAVNLLTGGQRKKGEWIANALFRPGARAGSQKPDLVLEEYWYEAGLPRVVEALGPAGLPMVLAWLFEYEKAAGRVDGWFSRPSIRERGDTHRDVEDALVDAVRDLAIAAMKERPSDTVDLMLSAGLMLARRIAMFAAIEALVDERAGAADTRDRIAAAVRLLFDPLSNEERCRIEFGELAREVARHDPSALEPLVGFISGGPALSAAELRERLRRDGDDSQAETETRFAEFIEGWEHSWLASVGAAALPAVLVRRLAELDGRLGVIHDPLRPPFVITSWSGPSSPLAQDQMAGMSPEELVAHLETWHDLGDGWGPEPSHEGQARELTKLLTASPQHLAGIRGLTMRLRPTYLRAIFNSWSAAFKSNLGLDWDQVVETLRDVVIHPDELDFPREGGNMDDDPDFTSAKKVAVSLLGDLVKPSESPQMPAEILHSLAELLIDLPFNDTAWAYYSGEHNQSEMDPLTLSLNWQWPIRVRGLAVLVGYGPNSPWHHRARTAFLAELERSDPRGAARAVVGENLGRLIKADEAWVEFHVPGWFGDLNGIDRGQQIALSSAMTIHHYHRTLFTLLSPSMLAAMALSGPVADGWRHHNSTPIQRIGEWAVRALAYGHVDWDNPVVSRFFGTVDPRERGAALGHVAWEFMHAREVEDSIRDRFAAVWDARIEHVESTPSDSAELREFYWLVRSEKFTPEWWLPRLKRSLELDPDLGTERYMIGKDIAKAADVDPRAAFDVTTLLLKAKQGLGNGLSELSRNAVPMVIARALAAEDGELNSDATVLMNELGEVGYLDLAKQVQAVLNGAITQADVDE